MTDRSDRSNPSPAAARHRAVRRLIAIVSAAVAVVSLLVPLGTTTQPAAAWEHLESGTGRCPTFPQSGSFYLVIDNGVPQEYRSSLTSAAAAWHKWSATTGVSFTAVAGLADVPYAGLPVMITSADYVPSSGWAYASATSGCDNDAPASGLIAIARSMLGGKSEAFKKYVFVHEIGHLLGLNHNSWERACATTMQAAVHEWWSCLDGDAPFPDDVAGVVALWRPQSVAGFPAHSSIFAFLGTGYALHSSTAYSSSPFEELLFRGATSTGYSDWTFVTDTTKDRWGWVVNSGSGMCLKSSTFVHPSLNRYFAFSGLCSGDDARWAVRQLSGGRVQLLNKHTDRCLGMSGGVTNLLVAAVQSCSMGSSRLTIQKSTVTRTKRSLPDSVMSGSAIIGSGSQRCVTATGGARTAGTGLSLKGCAGAVEQKWKFHEVSGGYALGLYAAPQSNTLDEPSPEMCAAGSGGAVSLRSCEVSPAQTWTQNPDGTIRNRATGTCLNVSGEGTADGSPLILYSCAATSNMVWSVPEPISDGQDLSLASVSSGAVLGTAAAPSGDADTRVRAVQTKNVAVASSRWRYTEVDATGGGLLMNLATGTCLRWRATKAQAGLDAGCNGADSSFRWAATPNAQGTWTVQSQYTGECLDVWGESTGEGAVIGTYSCTGKPNQLWRTIRNPSPQPVPSNVPNVGANLAMFGTSSQSSDYGPRWTAEQAIDGSVDEAISAETLTHTNSEQNPWWQVDLGEPTAMGAVTIYNRTDCCAERSTDVWILASNSPFPATGSPQSIAAMPGVVSTHSTSNTGPALGWSPGGSYQYVRVQLGTTNPLSLREVTILP